MFVTRKIKQHLTNSKMNNSFATEDSNNCSRSYSNNSSTASSGSCSNRSISSSSESSSQNELTGRTNYKTHDDNDLLHSKPTTTTTTTMISHKLLDVITIHTGSITSLSFYREEFIITASSNGNDDILVWQRLPNLRKYTKFGSLGGGISNTGSVKAVVTAGNKVFTAHQDSSIRVWKLSDNVFRQVNTLPTNRDYLSNCMNQRNYVQTRRHHRKQLWIKHTDSVSCLAVCGGYVYSGSWDKTVKVWRVEDLKCVESIAAHDDAINGLVAVSEVLGGEGSMVFTASADGKVKAWMRRESFKDDDQRRKKRTPSHELVGVLEGNNNNNKDQVSMNAVVVMEDNGEGITGRLVVYGGGSDGYVRGWRMEAAGVDGEGRRKWRWEVVCAVKAHKMAVLCMCVKGEVLCSGSADKTIGMWRMKKTGELERFGVISGHEGPVKCLEFAAAAAAGDYFNDGFLVYSGSLDKSIRVWWINNQQKQQDEENK